jgi:hypothetical protein
MERGRSSRNHPKGTDIYMPATMGLDIASHHQSVFALAQDPQALSKLARQEQLDVICLQEIKMSESNVRKQMP